MPSQSENRSGLQYGWGYGENGWNVGMDANMLRLGRFGFHLSVKDRDLTSPPGSPAAGDSYIVAVGASDGWLGLDNRVVVWDGASWVSAMPRIGWVAYVEDEEVLSAFKAGGWSAGIAI